MSYSLDDKTKFLIYRLQTYHNKGLAGRLGLVQFFIDQIRNNTESDKKEQTDEKFGLNFKEKTALLQIGCVSQLMILVEDVGIFCKSIMSDDLDYYQHLDRKGEEDLGNIIGDFYASFDNLTDDEYRKILSLVHPEQYEFKTIDDKQIYISILLKSIQYAKYFVGKTVVFRDSHIKIFRRYKHAGFPILLANDIPVNDDLLFGKFEFVSFALTSKENPEDQVTSLPFSNQVLDSYQQYLIDIYLFLRTVINSKLLTIERHIPGIFPYANDFFSDKLTSIEKTKLLEFWKDLEERFPSPGSKYEARVNPECEYTAWYLNLQTYSESALDLAKIDQQ